MRKDFFITLQWYRLALIVIAFDQMSKLMISLKLMEDVPVVILPVFNLMLAYNKGAAFSFLHDAGGWQRWFFSGLAAVVSVVLVVWISRVHTQKMLASALALVLGGAVGNLIDRVRFGHVVDFLSFHWHQYYFPAFNLADTAITIGAGLLLLDMLLNPERHSGKQLVSDKRQVSDKRPGSDKQQDSDKKVVEGKSK